MGLLVTAHAVVGYNIVAVVVAAVKESAQCWYYLWSFSVAIS